MDGQSKAFHNEINEIHGIEKEIALFYYLLFYQNLFIRMREIIVLFFMLNYGDLIKIANIFGIIKLN